MIRGARTKLECPEEGPKAAYASSGVLRDMMYMNRIIRFF